jgi:hypothetical protein
MLVEFHTKEPNSMHHLLNVEPGTGWFEEEKKTFKVHSRPTLLHRLIAVTS